ncbi:MAG: MCE family protein [Acetobacteraceae bacterium]|nr:MCE family protein [Acetobacteraceae bacterium]
MAAARPAVVGGFVLGALALAVAGILFFGGTSLFQKTTRAVIFFEGSVAGLDVGAPVTFRGVRVGSVQRVALQLSALGQARIPVTIEIVPGQVTIRSNNVQHPAADIERLVDAGLRAQLRLQSLVTGQLQVDLDFHPDIPAARAVGDTGGLPLIPSIPSEFERLRTTLEEVPVQEVVQTAQRTLATVERLARRLDDELGPLMESTRSTMASANRALDATEQVVVRLQSDVSRTLQELDGLLTVARRQLDDRGTDLARVLGSADRAARHAESLIASLESLTAPRSQFRSDLEAAARDLAASAGSLRGFARAIERDPSAVLRGRSAR